MNGLGMRLNGLETHLFISGITSPPKVLYPRFPPTQGTVDRNFHVRNNSHENFHIVKFSRFRSIQKLF